MVDPIKDIDDFLTSAEPLFIKGRELSLLAQQIENSDKNHKELLQAQNKFYKETLSKQSDLNKWTRILSIATIILAIATITLCIFTISTAISTKKSVELQLEIYSPKITAQITDKPLLWSHYAIEYEYIIPPEYYAGKYYKLPIYVEINNDGIIPFQIYNIAYKSNCGNGNEGLLSFPENFSKVIETGKKVSFIDALSMSFDQNVLKGLPCNVDFTIYGNNLIQNKKIIITS